ELGEFLGPRPRQLPEARITRSSAHESEAANQQAPITIKPARCIGDTIYEIQSPLDRSLAAGDLISCFGHLAAVCLDAGVSGGAVFKIFEVIDTAKENYTMPHSSRLIRR